MEYTLNNWENGLLNIYSFEIFMKFKETDREIILKKSNEMLNNMVEVYFQKRINIFNVKFNKTPDKPEFIKQELDAISRYLFSNINENTDIFNGVKYFDTVRWGSVDVNAVIETRDFYYKYLDGNKYFFAVNSNPESIENKEKVGCLINAITLHKYKEFLLKELNKIQTSTKGNTGNKTNLKGFQSILNDKKTETLFEQLKGSYIDKSTDEDCFKAIFKNEALPDGKTFEPVKWILLNRKKQPHKTALRELLTLVTGKSPDQ